jgi:hypothetical protein
LLGKHNNDTCNAAAVADLMANKRNIIQSQVKQVAVGKKAITYLHPAVATSSLPISQHPTPRLSIAMSRSRNGDPVRLWVNDRSCSLKHIKRLSFDELSRSQQFNPL